MQAKVMTSSEILLLQVTGAGQIIDLYNNTILLRVLVYTVIISNGG